ncbi:hypothetical protein [Candidatus Endomicrobiellum trichonymphae]|uniref:hypothetical protein n=1 Tax=Endomicrobium trichonymphae TaxID=1408204 RepID=UPI000864F497|nr:hypothetical protein [Candidatus Endomicrobium trichonymphae]BAV59307.1 hypothetical protein RSTT_P2-002 [Candidatus Endomicrobium trichonymphae]
MKKTIILLVVFLMFSGCYKKPITNIPVPEEIEEIKIPDVYYFSDMFTACNCFLAISTLFFLATVMFAGYSFFGKDFDINDYRRPVELGNRIVPQRGNNI